MDRLSEKERELVALGAALGSNCIPCIVCQVGVAKKAGITDDQLEEVVELADKVRRVPAEQALRTAKAHIGKSSDAAHEKPDSASQDCGCKTP